MGSALVVMLMAGGCAGLVPALHVDCVMALRHQ